MIQAEEHEVSSISTVTEADDLRSSCSKGFSDCRQTAEHGSFSQILHNKKTYFAFFHKINECFGVHIRPAKLESLRYMYHAKILSALSRN